MNKINYLTHNWLAIKINNQILQRQLESGNIKGVVYDLGCGEKPYELDILNIAEKYIGVDWNQTLHNLRADVVADLNKKLPVDSECADTVTSFQVLEHLAEPQLFLNESCRILKKDGYLILTVPFQWWVHEAPYDYYRYTPHGLRYMLEKAGFRDIKIKASSGFFSMLVLKVNYFTYAISQRCNKFGNFIRKLLIPFWFISQGSASILDKIDNSWDLECMSYIVLAKK